MKLSKSTVGMFKQCPYRFFRTKIEGWKPAKIPAQLKKGIEIHDHLEYAIKGAKTINDVKTNIQKRTIVKEQATDIINFFGWQQNRRLPLYIEEDFYNEERNISGRVDRIEMDENGKFILIDYKSGKGKWNKRKDKNTGEYFEVIDWSQYRFELAIYTFLFESSHNQKIDRWGIFFTGKNKYAEEPVVREEIIKALDEVKRVRAEIHKAQETNQWSKNSSYLCRYCEIFQNGECDCGVSKPHDEFDDAGKLVI